MDKELEEVQKAVKELQERGLVFKDEDGRVWPTKEYTNVDGKAVRTN